MTETAAMRSESAPERHEARLRREIAATVHELRTPLTTIRGFLETLLVRGDDLEASVRTHILQIAIRNAVVLGQRVDTLLEFERFTADEATLMPAPTRLVDAVAEVIEDCAGLLGEHHVDVDVPDTIWAQVDQHAFAHVLANLVSNAVRHSPAGATLRVRAWMEHDGVRLSVRDWGSGIEPDVLPYVFDAFYRGGEQAGGVGLGLSVVDQYVGMWGGTIDIVSSPGDGTTVTFTLPASSPSVDLEVITDLGPHERR